MKKIIFALFLCFATSTFAQIILNSHPLELKKSSENHQILNAVNDKDEVFIFASDKENLKILKYNAALFFKDSLSVKRPEKSYRSMIGYSFDQKGNPYLHWASEDYTKIQTLFFDFETRTPRTISNTFQFKDEVLLNTFSKNNSFYLYSLIEKEDKLKFYVFKNGNLTEKTIDFSSYNFTNENGKLTTFNALIATYSIGDIDTKSLNPLFQGTPKIKSYILENRMILTFDSSIQTQAFEINLTDFTVSEKKFPRQSTKDIGKSNSYFHQDKLYQLKTNEEELILAATDFNSGELLQTYSVTQNENISFRNSPLYIQTGREKGKNLNNTKKFLQRLSRTEVGLSVYKTPQAIMVTVGGVRDVNSTGSVILGVAVGVAGIASGNGVDASGFGLFDGSSLQSIYFEGLFDEKLQHIKDEQQILAVDYLSQFMSQTTISLETFSPFQDYFILGYYDSKKKEYVMRKFEDDLSDY